MWGRGRGVEDINGGNAARSAVLGNPKPEGPKSQSTTSTVLRWATTMPAWTPRMGAVGAVAAH